MHWLMNWLPTISVRRATGVCFLAGFLALGLLPAAAQDVEQRYKQAVDFYNNLKMEDACELLQQIEKERPGYTKTYLNPACKSAAAMRQREESLFNAGEQFFNQGDYDSAKQSFEQVAKIPLKNPRYGSQISRRLSQIEKAEKGEELFQEGVRLFNGGKYSEAQSRLNQVVQGGGSKAGEARALLGKINDALGKQRAEEEMNKLFNDGVQLFKAGKNAEAFYKFDQVAKGGGSKAGEARNYLQRIEQANRAAQQPPKPPPGKEVAAVKPPVKPTLSRSETAPRPETPTPVASEQTLRAGLQAYFQGNLEDAERSLSAYLNNNGQKQALAYFFRGAARSTRYLLSGETDSQQKELAVADFRAVKQRAGQFQPPQKKYVSPKILALYSEAVGAP